MSKASVAFDLPASPASSVAPPLRVTRTTSKAVGGVLVAIMGVVFGVGIMYLLSRVMQTSRKLTQLERTVKLHRVEVSEALAQRVVPPAPVASSCVPPQPHNIAPSPNEMDVLMELFMHDVPLPYPHPSTFKRDRVVEVIEEKEEVKEEVKCIDSKPESTKEAQAALSSDEDESESSSTSSSEEEEKPVRPPPRARGPPRKRGAAQQLK
jgi:hypothetical protein